MSGILFSPPLSTWGQPPSAVRQSDALPSVAPGKKLVELRLDRESRGRLSSRDSCRASS